MGKQEALSRVTAAFAPKPDDRLDRRVWWEIRCARLRLAMAENSLGWAAECLASGHINASAALEILDEVMDEIAGAKP